MDNVIGADPFIKNIARPLFGAFKRKLPVVSAFFACYSGYFILTGGQNLFDGLFMLLARIAAGQLSPNQQRKSGPAAIG